MNYRLLTIAFISLLMSGCSLVPVSFTQEELKEQAKNDRSTVTQNQEAIDGPVTLYEAIARALKYNLDFHLEFSEKILAETSFDLSKYELLPQLVAKTGYNSRDKFSGSSSRSLLTGTQSLQSSTSSDRDIFTSDLSLSWNVLDFGLSYIRAKQSGDKVLIAEEEKRKVVNRIVQDVRTAYWRAVSNDRLIERIEKLLIRVSKAIEESKKIEVNRLDRPLTALTYQRELIGIKRELEELQRDLSLAKIQLAALMNLRPGEEYELVIPDRTEVVNKVDISPDMMEQLALENRPEIRTVSYEERINRQEAKAAILSLMPGLDLNFGKSYSTNSFLFHNNWLSYGAQISWNLLNIFKLPSTNKNIEAKAKVLEARRLALTMAIMTQVHVSMAQYRHSQREYNTAADYFLTQQKILEQLESGVSANTVTEQSLIREQMNMMVAEIKYDIAYSDVENAYASIFASLGIDPFPIDTDTSSVKSLTSSIMKYFDGLSLHEQLFSMKIE
ncbi:MAG: TolC family protein [Proteobacteria bacterium]|nr:TolC family protein [Pseudomonadota bacterium]NOG61121.1 TolC family protein [Pseudomonadota bacterium]